MCSQHLLQYESYTETKKGKNGEENLRGTDEAGRFTLWEHTQKYIDLITNFQKFTNTNKCLIEDDE